MIRVVVVDDQPLIKQSLATLLSVEDDFEVVGQAGDGREAIQICHSEQPDVVLMDVQMPVLDGVLATREIVRQLPHVKVLVLTTFADDQYIVQSLKAGASGYLLKNMQPDLLAAAVRGVHAGLNQIDPSVSAKIAQFIIPQQSTTRETPIAALKHLSSREVEVLRLLGDGMNNREISTSLHIAEGTVRNYVSNILLSLGAADRTHAAIWSLKHLVGH
jgi:DNA-binding NarL/FixJ family response regulator